MKHKVLMMLVCAAMISSLTAYGQMMKRQDAVWARNSATAITVDGKLTEAGWATADSFIVHYGQSSGMPGGGWAKENGVDPTDPTNATFKFLVKGDSLYIGVVCRDKSIGAGLWAHNDALLMNMRYASPTGMTGTPRNDGNLQQNGEIYYGWVSEGWADSTTIVKGSLPACLGFWGSAYIHPRPDSLKAIWDAVTTVQGSTNDDSKIDTSWTTEIVINLKHFGYKPQQAGGDIAMWSTSVWDNDYEWPLDTAKQAANRVFLQGPWGNASSLSHLKVFMRSDVTTTSGAVPVVGPDYVIPVASAGSAAPVIDGKLTDPVWKFAPSLQMKYGDANIRKAYPNTLKYRSGQSQLQVNGATNPVVDASLATVKYFVKADTLYLGFDVNDRFVQSSGDANRMDGFDIIVNDRSVLDGDNAMLRRNLQFRVDSAGLTKRMGDLGLGQWDSLGTKVRVKISLKGGTTVDTVGTSADSGYTAEMAIALPSLGYATGRGDGVFFFSIIYYDGDSFSGGSYGTKTWLGRPGDWDDGPAWAYMDAGTVLGVKENGNGTSPAEFSLLGNYPNPFNPTTNIKFQISRASEVTLEVFDIIGRQVTSQSLGVRQAGDHSVQFDASHLASGSYFYRLKMVTTGATAIGKMILLK